MTPDDLTVQPLTAGQYPAALALAERVFARYEAPEYPPEGVRAFHDALRNNAYLAQLRFYGAIDRGAVVGVLATRECGGHIALFFVDSAYQHRGIGRRLFQLARDSAPGGTITVHAAPYAVVIYRRLGFTATSGEQQTDGMRYTPMCCRLHAERND